MIRSIIYAKTSKSHRHGGEKPISAWRASDCCVISVGAEGRDTVQHESLLRDFEIQSLAIQGALRPRNPQKIEQCDNYFFPLLQGLYTSFNGIKFHSIQLSLFVTERFLLSRYAQSSFTAIWLHKRLLLRKLTGIASNHQQVATELRSSEDLFFDGTSLHWMVDLFERVKRTLSLDNLLYQIYTDLTEGYLGSSSHRLNRVMQILSIITVIFVTLTFFAGIYGMNFENMPELSTRKGFFVVFSIMLTIAIVQLIYFRQKRWV